MADRLQVLILDDEPIVGKRLQPAMAKIGCDVEVFDNPHEAISRIDEKQFDVVVTDIRMEGINGIEVLEHVQARSDRTKVIMITGYATVEVAHEALAKGAYDFIAKPFKPEELRKVVLKAAGELGFSKK